MGAAKPLLILGTTTFPEEIADVAAQSGREVVGFIETLDIEKRGTDISGRPVLWVDDLAELAGSHEVVCGMATTQTDRYIALVEAHHVPFTTVVHTSAVVSGTVELEPGCVICPQVVIGAHSRLGRHVLLNRGVLVGHHTEIGDFCSLMPGANVAGNCVLEPSVYVGLGASIIDHVSIGEGAVVAAGAVVTRDVEARTQVGGIPARVMKEDVKPR